MSHFLLRAGENWQENPETYEDSFYKRSLDNDNYVFTAPYFNSKYYFVIQPYQFFKNKLLLLPAFPQNNILQVNCSEYSLLSIYYIRDIGKTEASIYFKR